MRTESLSADPHIFAVADDWPNGRTMLIEQAKAALRSLDGGAMWSSVALPPGVTRLRLPPATVGGERVAFALASSGLYRSADQGDTWQLAVPSVSPGQLLLS